MFDDESADGLDQALIDSEAERVEDDESADETGERSRTGRFSAEEAARREARDVKPRSTALAPPPPGP